MNSEVGNSLIKIIIKKQGWGDGGADEVVVVGCYRVRSRDCGQPSFELSGVTPHRGPPHRSDCMVWLDPGLGTALLPRQGHLVMPCHNKTVFKSSLALC